MWPFRKTNLYRTSMGVSVMSNLELIHNCFSPKIGGTLCDQLTNCYQQLTDYSVSEGYTKQSILKQTIFISVSDDLDYYQSKQNLLVCAKEFFGEPPPTCILAQSPANTSLVLEVFLVEGLQSIEIFYRHNDQSSWIIFQRGELKILVAAGLCNSIEQHDPHEQSNEAFDQLHQILIEEKMEFSDIIRQWNYIEQITKNGNLNSQHYQMFNDVRSKFYRLSKFKNGFPAATGIGIDFGGIIIDILAVKYNNDCSVISVKSPVQLDAYQYSKDVLAENNSICEICCTTPKFERAKLFSISDNKMIFISGTAAITGQASTNPLSVELQTEMTIQNMLSLISIENIEKHGFENVERTSLNYIRVYVKYKKDIKSVKKVCLKYFYQIPIVYVIADICRPELLVEIEAQGRIN